MIDLLPPEIKEARTYARRNRTMLRWCTACSLAIFGILTIGVTGYFFINNAAASAEKVKSQTEKSIEDAKLGAVEKDYVTFSNNLKTVVQILSNQVLFSDLIQQIGGVTPNGATLNSVSLSDKDNALDLDFTVSAASLVPTIQVNLEDPKNDLFEKADVVQVACQKSETTGQDGCNVQLRALFKEDAKFLFLNSVESGGAVR